MFYRVCALLCLCALLAGCGGPPPSATTTPTGPTADRRLDPTMIARVDPTLTAASRPAVPANETSAQREQRLLALLRAAPYGSTVQQVKYRTASDPATIEIDFTLVLPGEGRPARVQARHLLGAAATIPDSYSQVQIRGLVGDQIVINLSYTRATLTSTPWDDTSTADHIWELAETGTVDPAYRGN